jgi:hypothetical protein
MIEPFFAGSVSSVPNWLGFPAQAPNLPQPFATGGGFPSLAGPGQNVPPAGFSIPGISPLGYSSTPYATSPNLVPIPAAAPFVGFFGAGQGGAYGPTAPYFSAIAPFGGQEPSPASALIAMIAMRRGQPMGPSNDQDIEAVLYDALEALPGTDEVEVRCENGRVTLSGNVSAKRIKHDVGEIAWAIPAATDVQNNLTLTSRRRGRQSQREQEPQQPAARKQA